MADNIIRTVYDSALQSCLLLGRPFNMVANSTLNEKFGIQPGVAPDANTIPTLKFYGIGNGGHSLTMGANNIPLPNVLTHRARDAALFNQLPFVLRELNNDLSVTERAKYALRRQETHNGNQYFAYYLKRIPMDTVVVGMEYTTVENDVVTVTAFTPDSSDLNPVPQPLSSSGVNLVDGSYVSGTAKLDLSLSTSDVTELRNVAKVIYNDEAYAIISEIALCSGVDKVVQVPAANNGVINFNEAIAVQILSHVGAFTMLQFNNTGWDCVLDCGSTEPLYALS